MSEKTENNKERITKMIDTAFIECYKEGFDDGYDSGLRGYNLQKTTMIDKSNFSREQYNLDLQASYDCGYSKGYKEALNKIKGKIENIASRYSISRERCAMGQVEWSDRLIKESEILQIIDKHLTEVEK